MSIRCWLVDDETAAHKGLSIALGDHDDFTLVKSFYSVDEVFESQQNFKDVDVLFLDIDMPRAQGFSVITRWSGEPPIVVFVTAFNEYALKAFELGSFDYLLKPLEQERVDSCLARIRQRHQEKQTYTKKQKVEALFESLKTVAPKQEMTIKTDEGLFRVNMMDIEYLEAAGNFVAFHFKEKTLINRNSLKSLEQSLPEGWFYRIHKSFVVNKSQIASAYKGKFGDGRLTLKSGIELKVSRRFNSIFSELAS